MSELTGIMFSGQMTEGTEEQENFIKIHNTANNDEW